MEHSKKSYTIVWQVCACEVKDQRGYCETCFSSKTAHLAEAMKDEDTFLRFPDLRIQERLNRNVLASGIKS